MTGFTLNQNDTFEGGIKDGNYEVVVTKMEEATTKNGAEHVDVRLTVRNDLQQQEHKNQIIFHKVWKAKATGKYDMRFFNTMGKAAQLQQGKQYASIEELFKDFLGKPVKVQVKNETSEYNGKTYENLNVKRWDKSDFPEVQHRFKSPSEGEPNPYANASNPAENVPNEDYPF